MDSLHDGGRTPHPSYHPYESQDDSDYNTFATPFTIGYTATDVHLVNAAQLKEHLALLHAFAALKAEVQGGYGEWRNTLPVEMDRERRWAWFVGLAVERFETWCKAMAFLKQTEIDDHLPPLDVVMVWHSYMLNPIWYSEDRIRIPQLQYLGTLGRDFANRLNIPGYIENAFADPAQPRIDSWVENTSSPFNLFVAAGTMMSKDIMCPYCKVSTKHVFMNQDGTGYLQHGFTFRCAACYRTITKEILALHKFAANVVRNDLGDKQRYSFLAGTVHGRTKRADDVRAKNIKENILKASKLARPDNSTDTQWEQSIMKNFEGAEFKELRSHIMHRIVKSSTGNGTKLVDRILSAYTDDRLFSIDLVGAVLRQGTFIKKMYDLNWTQPSFFESEEDGIALQHAIARYHAFLDLMANSSEFLVPTLDIDLVWHTHQLNAKQYSEDCLKYLKRHVDHDDKVEENFLATSFDTTCREWKSRYGVDYAHCGCPIPGKTLAQKLSRLLGNYSESKQSLIVTTQALSPVTDEFLAATHPSDHNAVYAFQDKLGSSIRRKQRKAIMELRQIRYDQKQQSKSNIANTAASARQHDHAQKELAALSNNRKTEAHEVPFLVPVPYWYYTPSGACVSGLGGTDIYGSAVDLVNNLSAVASGCGSVSGCGAITSCSSSSGGCGSSGCGGGGGCGGGCGGGGCGGS